MFASMSDGKSDGFVLMYCKDGVVYPIALTQDDVDMLGLTISMAIRKVRLITDKPQGSVTQLLDKKESPLKES